MDVRMREAIVVGPSGNPVVDIDPGMIEFDAESRLANHRDPVLAGMVSAILDIENEPGVMAGTHHVVWSDNRSWVATRCPECEERVDVDLFVIEGDDSGDAVVCMACVASMDDDHPAVCGDADCDRH